MTGLLGTYFSFPRSSVGMHILSNISFDRGNDMQNRGAWPCAHSLVGAVREPPLLPASFTFRILFSLRWRIGPCAIHEPINLINELDTALAR